MYINQKSYLSDLITKLPLSSSPQSSNFLISYRHGKREFFTNFHGAYIKSTKSSAIRRRTSSSAIHQSLEFRPTNHHRPLSINVPLIDLSNQSNSIRKAIARACREWGTFHVINHCVPLKLLHAWGGRSSKTLRCPKNTFSCGGYSVASEGYGSKMLVNNDDTVLNWRDYFDYRTLPHSRRRPEFPHEYSEVVANYGDEMKLLAEKLLGFILDFQSNYIRDAVGEFYQNFTISYYPTCPQPELTLGLQTHSDMGALTLLIQDDVGGFQVLKDGEWITIRPLSDAIVVILADQTQVLTNIGP